MSAKLYLNQTDKYFYLLDDSGDEQKVTVNAEFLNESVRLDDEGYLYIQGSPVTNDDGQPVSLKANYDDTQLMDKIGQLENDIQNLQAKIEQLSEDFLFIEANIPTEDSVNRIVENNSTLKGAVEQINQVSDAVDSFDTIYAKQQALNEYTKTENMSSWLVDNKYVTTSDIESELTQYAKSSDIPSLEAYATKEFVESQGYLTEHQDLSHLITSESYQQDQSIVTEKQASLQTELNSISNSLNEYAKSSQLDEYLTQDAANATYVTQEYADNTYTQKTSFNDLAALVNQLQSNYPGSGDTNVG